jgi:hypothetical protein
MAKTPEHELRRQAKNIAKRLFPDGKTLRIPDPDIEREEKLIQAFFELARAAKAGDREARRQYNQLARMDGLANWQELDAEISMLIRMVAQELPAGFWSDKSAVSPEWAILLERALDQRNILSDPVFRMICTRLQQKEVINDPVLGTIQNAPIKEIYEATMNRCGEPIRFDTPKPTDATPVNVRESPNKERDEKIRQFWRQGKTDADIAPLVNLSVDRIKQIRRENGWIDQTRRKKTT